MRVFILIFALVFAAPLSASAQDVVAGSDAQELRARDVGRKLRCVVCQNQSIEESDAQLARDMRVVVRERMADGQSDAEIIDYMRERYGDYVLLKPPVQTNTYALWFLPLVLVLGMLFWLVRFNRRRVAVETRQLSDAERVQLNKMLEDDST